MDGIVDVVRTQAEADALEIPPLLIVDRAEEFLDASGIGTGPLHWHRIGGGQSNVSFRIKRKGADVVLRRGPRPPLPPSTHDMVREARIQHVLAPLGVPVPKILAVCADPNVLGVPFYVMKFLDGVVVTDSIPAHLDAPAQRRATGEAAADMLVRLHSVDISHGAVADIGRPDGYLQRQVRRFAGLWELGATRPLPRVGELAEWLEANRPDTQRTALIHGDYRIGNLMFAKSGPARIQAVLDWEMATLGDPLADLGYLTATYAQAGSPGTFMELTSVTAQPGYPTRDELALRYNQHFGLDLSALPWYQVLALWKAAIFSEAIYTRWLRGERDDGGQGLGAVLEEGVPRLLDVAGGFARRMP
ncbi:phosphotransferase family protein [Arthrobacter sp. A2-55]|uniref:phosphotransferase family protein n=1 Tax=Arthrobacter sp. A2-55 TaxID=2897337 RepID=UPI0021CD3121|nr:phosphotransferase family protein [Arthrobacter sp. A2-55]MCU6481251.1 phosphotransferase family protein [Arthrobacter sp. A2-55]